MGNCTSECRVGMLELTLLALPDEQYDEKIQSDHSLAAIPFSCNLRDSECGSS